MTAIADFKAAVILKLDRDDMGSGGALEQALTDAITAAIEFHADELFWFNRTSGTKATVASTATIALPTGMRAARAISYDQTPLTKVNLEDIEYLTETGTPEKWAENDGAIQLSPVPAAVYTLTLYGIADLGFPASTNEWIVEGKALIDARTRLILYRDYLRDVEGAALAAGAEQDALTKLRRETRRRGVTGLVSDLPVPTGYNVLTV